MVQGKFKKAKLPEGLKKKQKHKGSAFTRRPNAPIQAKKTKFTEHQKIKQVITKNVNRSVEDEIRSAAESEVKLSKTQETVAKVNNSRKAIDVSKKTLT